MRARLPLVLALLCAAPASADVVELTTGQKLEGKVKQVTPADVVVDVGGKETKVERAKVRAIQLDAPATPRIATPTAAREAMSALRAVESAASSGGALADYTHVVADAGFAVDRYLRDPDDAPAKVAMKDAVALYRFAASAWETRLRTYGYAALETDPALEKCPQVKKLLEKEDKAAKDEDAKQKAAAEREAKAREKDRAAAPPPAAPAAPTAFDAGQVIAVKGVPAIWACASGKVGQAQTLLDTPPAPAPAKK